jgi:hypothetical protein
MKNRGHFPGCEHSVYRVIYHCLLAPPSLVLRRYGCLFQAGDYSLNILP